MKWSRDFVTAASVLGLTCIFGAQARTSAAAPAPSSTEQLVSSVLTLKQIGRLGLTQGQLRDIVQRLSTLSHAENSFAAHRVEAARPIVEQLHRIKAALQAGNTPDAADQTAVDRALAGLRPEQIHVEQMRSETISGIRQILTADQMTTLRGFLGIEARPGNSQGPYDLYFGNYQPQLRRRFKYKGPPDDLPQAPPAVDLPAAPPVGLSAAPGVDLPPAPAAAEAPADLTTAPPPLLKVDPNQVLDRADALQVTGQLVAAAPPDVDRDLIQAIEVAAPADKAPLPEGALVPTPTPTATPDAGPDQPGDNGLDGRIAALEARMARIQQLLEKLMGPKGHPVQMELPVITAPRGPGGNFGPYTVQPLTQHFINGGMGNAAAGDGPSDEGVVARFFLQPEVLSDLRSLAAR